MNNISKSSRCGKFRKPAVQSPFTWAFTFSITGIFLFVSACGPTEESYYIYSGEEPIDEFWSPWSRNDLLNVEFSEEAKTGKGSIRVEYPDVEPIYNHDWSIHNNERIVDVEPYEEWTATAWVKYENTLRVGMELIALSEGEPVTHWRGGYAAAYGTGDWELLEASAVMPPGADQVRVRVSGSGRTLAWIDDIQLQRGLAQRKTPPRPPVEGWAYQGERVEQKPGRGLMALPLEHEAIYLRWRLLKSDPDEVAFNIYRSEQGNDPVKLNDDPIRATTDFIDDTADLNVENTYSIRPVTDGTTGDIEGNFSIEANPVIRPYRSIKLQDEETTFQKVGIADLNGDGKLDFVIKTPDVNVDPYYREGYWRPSETTYKLEAYLSDGTFLWQKDLGWNIETGIWYSPYIVHDFNGNGRAEVAVKTGPEDRDYRETEPSELYDAGRVMSGPEYLSILDGMTGEEITRTDWPSRDEGFGAYNYYSRNMLGIAYLDGKTPCLVVARGTYNVQKLITYQLRGNELEELWAWESGDEPGGLYYAQGDHYIHTVDLNGDGRESIVIGAAVVDSNGDGLWSTGLSHVDNVWVGNIDPNRPGLEIYYGVEGTRGQGSVENGISLWDGATGELIWGLDQRTYHIHGTGMVSNIDARYAGMETYSGESGRPERWLHSATGELIANEDEWSVGLSPRPVYWDETPEREVLVRNEMIKFPDQILADNIEGRQAAWLDLYGDWREEVITSVPGELRIYSTTIPAIDRRVTLLQDHLYRNGVTHLSMGYGQPPLTSYYIGREIPVSDD